MAPTPVETTELTFTTQEINENGQQVSQEETHIVQIFDASVSGQIKQIDQLFKLGKNAEAWETIKTLMNEGKINVTPK
jgi:hypothetical protein